VIILDTNIVSAMMQREPNAVVTQWLDQNSHDTFWLTAISVFELRVGIEILDVGRNRRRLEDALNRVLEVDVKNQILFLDERAAATAASIAAARSKIGRPAELRDTLIAGIAVAHRANLVTRNVRHFEGLDIRVINPWDET